MKVVEILGGLGSQMFKYAFYEGVKEKCSDEVYIDTSSYFFRNIWNGYELKKIFGIDAPDIWNEKMAPKTDRGIYQITDYRKYAYMCIREMGKAKKVTYFSEGRESVEDINRFLLSDFGPYKAIISMYGKLKNFKKTLTPDAEEKSDKVIDGAQKEIKVGSYYPDNYLAHDYAMYDECDLQDETYFGDKKKLKKIFTFPEWSDSEIDKKNKRIAEQMLSEESVAIHIRRGDHMYDNKELFYKYFSDSVKYILEKVPGKKVHFYIFSDEPVWCQENSHVLGFTEHRQENDRYVLTFVSHNNGKNSYKDMQLMTCCKHNIIPCSTFSWWGAFLSKHSDEEKIVIAPKGYWPTVKVHL